MVETSVQALLQARAENRIESVSWWRVKGQGKTFRLAFADVLTNFSSTVREGKNGGLQLCSKGGVIEPLLLVDDRSTVFMEAADLKGKYAA